MLKVWLEVKVESKGWRWDHVSRLRDYGIIHKVCWLAWLQYLSKIDKTSGKCRSCRGKLGEAVSVCAWSCSSLISWPLSMRSAANEKSEYFQLKVFLLYWYFSRRNKREHLQYYWLCSINNLFKTDTWITSEPIGSDESSNFLYP